MKLCSMVGNLSLWVFLNRPRGEGIAQLLERYAMYSARWIQYEEMTNRMGFFSKHPTTQKPIPSPFITSASTT